MGLTEFILKSKSGTYKDNKENRRLHRVGQHYGETPKVEDYKAIIERFTSEYPELKGKNYRELPLKSLRKFSYALILAHRAAEEAGNWGARGKISTLMSEVDKYQQIEEKKFAERNKAHSEAGFDTTTSSMVEFANNPERVVKRAEIVTDYLNRASRQGGKPIAVFMSGGAGSGKSTVMRKLKEIDDFYKKVITIDSDDIKTKALKEDFDFYNTQKDYSAAGRLHDESSVIADEIFTKVSENGLDYIKDGTLKTYENAKRDILAAKSKGAIVRVVGVTIPVEEAIKRAEIRAAKSGRAVGTDFIVKTHIGSTSTYLQLIEDGIVDDMTLWDNSGDDPVLVYDSKQQPPVRDEKLFNQYKAKKDFIMDKEIVKSYNFGQHASDRRMKRIAQERLKKGLPVSVDIPTDADPEDVQMLLAFDAWLMDGEPVED